MKRRRAKKYRPEKIWTKTIHLVSRKKGNQTIIPVDTVVKPLKTFLMDFTLIENKLVNEQQIKNAEDLTTKVLEVPTIRPAEIIINPKIDQEVIMNEKCIKEERNIPSLNFTEEAIMMNSLLANFNNFNDLMFQYNIDTH